MAGAAITRAPACGRRNCSVGADATGLSIEVRPVEIKVEHRLFSYISTNTRGRPLSSYEVIANVIAHTRTATGLKVHCQLDQRSYPTGIVVSDEELRRVQIEPEAFHPEWNDRILPHAAPVS